MGGAVSAGEDNDELVDNLVQEEYLKTALIERVFRAVDRGDYYLDGCKENAYRDLAWKHGNLHISAPCIYSKVMEALKIERGMSFLNLGSGTGYLSTLVGLLLGPYGVNHGIEIHEDVLEYAKKRLQKFKQNSLALDEFELCEPHFVLGNCLQLSADVCKYDRVYCGASCPTEYENHTKNLLKVGGILVMPLNDQLVQIRRVSHNRWETVRLLPVSFASLIIPSSEDLSTSINTPEVHPLSLQDICRSVVRELLRQQIDLEHPKIKAKIKHSKKRRKHKRVIPLSDESDGEGGHRGRSNNQLMEPIFRSSPSQVTSHMSALTEQVTRETENHLAPSVRECETSEEGGYVADSVVSLSLSNSATANEPVDEQEVDKDNNIVSKEIQFSTVDNQEETLLDSCTETVEGETSPALRRRFSCEDLVAHRDKKRGAEEGYDKDQHQTRRLLHPGRQESQRRARTTSQRLSLVWKKVVPADHYSDSDSGDSKVKKTPSTRDELAGSYTQFMREKIIALPLPFTLKSFLNYHRPF